MNLAVARLIVVMATAGFRHESIPIAEQVITSVAERMRIEVTFVRLVCQARANISN